MTRLVPEKKLLRRCLLKLGWEATYQLLSLQEADMGSKGTGNPEEQEVFSAVRSLLEEIRTEDACLSLKDLAVKGGDLMALGITGREIGTTLNTLLEQVLEEALPNEKQALLDHVRKQQP